MFYFISNISVLTQLKYILQYSHTTYHQLNSIDNLISYFNNSTNNQSKYYWTILHCNHFKTS